MTTLASLLLFCDFLENLLHTTSVALLRRIFSDFYAGNEHTLQDFMRLGASVISVMPFRKKSSRHMKEAARLLAEQRESTIYEGCIVMEKLRQQQNRTNLSDSCIFRYLFARVATKNIMWLRDMFNEFCIGEETMLREFVRRGSDVISIIPVDIQVMGIAPQPHLPLFIATTMSDEVSPPPTRNQIDEKKSSHMVISRRRRLCVAMCCDFFYPRLGGVEMHMWSLAQCLLRRGHKVIVLTHAVPGPSNGQIPTYRTGVRYMTHGLKVYYLPVTPVVDNVTYLTFINHLALFRCICIRECVQIVHGHQATSTFMHECLLQAKTLGLGIKTVYTDHSLFGFADAASVHLNKVMKFSMSTVDAAIGVSHTCRENLVLRASLSPDKVSTIPNAVDATKFTPPATVQLKAEDSITVVIISRLVYRKGIDLVARTIPLIIIGGNEREVPTTRSGDFMWGCASCPKAAACGLFVVSTKVGGVPEVLPPDMVQFATDMTPESLAEAVLAAVPRIADVNRQEFHDRVAKMYNWEAVAVRTENVYEKVRALPDTSLLHRLQLYHGIGPVAGMLACVIVAVLHLYVVFLEWWQPAVDIELALDWDPKEKRKTE
ncbi:hypothetical protein Plhal703r1_c10g0053601 [Plasmopara halstedii]